jgi:archaeal cell division control protein 6
MGVFDDVLKDRESLIRDEIALDPDYIPKILPFRDQQQHYIASCIKPLFSSRSGKNLLVIGPPGIGKTAATKWVLREMEEKGYDEKVVPLFINAWKKDTPHKVILDICNQIGYKFTHNRTTDELFKEVTRILNKKACVIVIDEADKIDNQQVYYMLAEDLTRKTIIFITNETNWLINLDKRVRSRLMPEILEFKPYNKEETHTILKERSNYAFHPDIFSKDTFDFISTKTFLLKDIRAGLFLLKESVLAAENQGLKKVSIEHAQKAHEKISQFKIKSSEDLHNPQQELLNMIKQNSGLTMGELQKLAGLSYSTFHRKIKELEKNRFIYLQEINDKAGRTNKVFYGQKTLDDFK